MFKIFLFAILLVTFVFGNFACNHQPVDLDNYRSDLPKIMLPPLQPTTIVIIDKYGNRFDTGVSDKILEDGSTISQKIQDCVNNSKNHGDFVSCMAHLTNWLLKKGYITNKEKGIIMNISARANIP